MTTARFLIGDVFDMLAPAEEMRLTRDRSVL